MSKVRARRNLDRLIEEMNPKQRDGLTINGEDVGTQPASSPTTSQLIGHLATEGQGKVGRIPSIQFVAESDPTEYWSMGDDRIVAGADVTVTPELHRAMQLGMVCLRCKEPQEHEFPIACDLCGYSMHELQVRDVAMEFDGLKHLGPSKPIGEYTDEVEERYLKEKFAKEIAGGKSPMKGLAHRA